MGKFRSKLKGTSKGKRWAKGQSSSSNPETNKHRNLARSRFFQENLGSSNLTSEAIRKHDAVQALAPTKTKPVLLDMEEDAAIESSTGSTYQTMDSFASEWSHCSNMSFNRFLRVFRSDSALHKEMLAVLAAITEVIKEKEGTESPTEYYCSLLTALEQVMTGEQKNEDQVTAILSLLNMGIKTVPAAVLQTGFNEVSKKILVTLNEFSSSENNVIVKSVFGILTGLLKAQEAAVWTLSSTNLIFEAILNPFCIHSKPKWRKGAQQAAIAVVRTSCFVKENAPNPAADKVAEFCQETLKGCVGGSSSVKANQTTILHVLGLMKDTINCFSKSHMKKSCELILQLMTLNYPIVTSCGLQVLHALFSQQTVVVPAKLNGQLIAALYEYQPAIADVQPMLAWLAVMQQAHIHLADVDVALAAAALPQIFSTITQLWLSERTEIMTTATHALERLLRDAVTPMCETPQLVEQHKSKLAKCFNAVELGLGYQYNTVWQQVLHVISVMFEVAGRNCGGLLLSCLKSLAELRDSYKFSHNNELEHAVGAAVRAMGADVVLSVIMLRKENGELNIDRSWLLPVLKENVKASTLEFWSQHILPLAIFCQKHSCHLSSINDGIGAHSYELLYLQLWNLLPSFCNKPTDVKASFKNIAKIMGTAISDHKELRLAVMASLRKIITHVKESENQEDIAEIARFDKNYLPILFNVYTTKPSGTDEEGQRLAALDTVKTYLAVAQPKLAEQLFENALGRLEASQSSDKPADIFVKESILDLIRVLVPYQKAEGIEKLYQQCIKSLPEIKNSKEQKKAYRLLEEICGNEADCCKEFLQKNRKAVQKLLMKSLESAVSSKGARLRCLTYLVKAQPHLTHESTLIRSIVPEAVMCCKDINGRCRAAAFALLNTVGEILMSHEQLQEYVMMLIAGLGGTPQLMSTTILALTSVLHNFSGALGNENIQLILENVSTIMAAPTREVVGSCLSFIKMYCSSLPSPVVAASLPVIIKSLTNMTEDCKRHYRLKVRDILDRLIRKYGCDSITPHIPTSDTVMYKRLRNLRKLNARKKKRKESSEDKEVHSEEEFTVSAKPKSIEDILADSDSDLDDVGTSEPKSNKRQASTWIQEDADTIVDFIDPKVTNRITATKPNTAPVQVTENKKKDRGFKTASDGRLIIEDDSSSSDSAKPSTKGFKNLKVEDSDSEEDAVSTAETMILSDKKRKRAVSGSTKSGFSSKSQPPMKYQAGGSGIHRAVSASSTYSGLGAEYKSKKAGGDMKKKGKVDPYIYLPLKRTSLNKRKKNKVIGQFKSIGKAARTGAKKGSKANKMKQRK